NIKFFVQDNVLPELTASPDLSKKEFSLDVERYPGQGYGATTFTPDFTEALAFLGIEDITAATLVGINADGSEEAAPGPGGIDGWCNSEGTFVGWGTEAKICVKFFPSVPQYEICDMNGGDVVGTTYTVKYALKANDKTAIYAINVKFVEKPVIYLADYTAKAETVELKIAAQDAEGNWAAESATEAINVADITALVGENYVVYGVGAKDGDKETLTNSYSCDPHPGFWCLADGTADVWANSTFGVSFYAAEGVFKTWTKAAVTEDLSTTFYFVNEEAKEYVAYKVVLCAPEVVDEWFAEGNFKVNDYVNGEKMAIADARYEVDPTDESNSCIVVTSNDEPANDYDAQLFISTTDPLNVGDVITLTMKVRADREQSAASQAHSTPGDYIHWACVGNINFTTEWTEITLTATVTADMSKEDKKMQTITFNLSDMTNKTANNFYFDDIKLEVAVPDAIEGVEAATAANGKYMENGKLVIIKNGKKFNAAGQAIK
ncbi:MAG: DUF4859 domain-containing protein, partial [Bacteroidales bacterium]|nr:DUF4859 domain-containing protein [Bacteroidales bacterium]